MFCPKCAAVLDLRSGTLTCVLGDMPLSQRLHNLLTQRYASGVPSPRKGVTSIEKDRWYCPGCGVMLNENLVCPECYRSIKDLQHELVELHPHKARSVRR
jgi:hypothetical protein